MGACGHPGVTDLDEDAVALIVILTVAVHLFQQCLCVADLTSDATARHGLEVCACSKRLCAKLLHGQYRKVNKTFYKSRSNVGLVI